MVRVELRQRKRENRRVSLYLDFYPPILDHSTGKMKRQEFLKLFIWDKPKGAGEKEHNKEILNIANGILSTRINQIRKAEIYSPLEKQLLKQQEYDKIDFIDYFKQTTRKRKGANLKTWQSVEKYLREYFPNGLKFGDIDEKTIEGFRDHLLTAKSIRSDKATLSQNTASSYFNKVKATLRQAFKEKILREDINGRIDAIEVKETRREYLNIEELKRLIETPCDDEILKRASLFSALTGLRFSDILKLKGSEVKNDDQGYSLQFTQQKTQGIETHYISSEAYSLLGDFKDDDSRIFDGLRYSAYSNKRLSKWIGLAGITKDITFHSFRHTYATLQLQHGTDIYTVSKLLGHKSLKTTQIYAKVVDEAKRKASTVIKLGL